MAPLNEIMTREVFTTTGDVSVADVANSMVKGRFGSAVVMEGSWLVGIFTLTLSAAYAVGDGDPLDLLLVTGGVVLLPAWLVWSGRLLRRAIPVER